MAFIDNYDFEHLKNEAENLVLKELGRQLEAYSAPLCRCNDCVVDMAAMALNTGKPLYRGSLLGSLYTAHAMNEKAYGTSVREAVFNAIERVRKYPSHDVEPAEEPES
ncbi:MAG: late competence development ComFB family protein, partial [Treponema sp.]|nr:late competence development ComFB family protein [Treponema sp.]